MDELVLEAYNWEGPMLILNVRNLVNLVFPLAATYINGYARPFTMFQKPAGEGTIISDHSARTLVINPRGVQTVSGKAAPNMEYQIGKIYPVKLTSADGKAVSFTVTCGKVG